MVSVAGSGAIHVPYPDNGSRWLLTDPLPGQLLSGWGHQEGVAIATW